MYGAHAMPFGAELRRNGGTRFRLWAPAARSVHLCLESSAEEPRPMERNDGGWFEHLAGDSKAGDLYRFLIDGDTRVPDPASRFQPQDVHGPSEVIDPCAFEWADGAWKGRPLEEAVFYELHVGAFSTDGSYDGVAARLDYLADLGVTALELMPLADTPGRRNWGYDGACLFAPESAYGRPERLKNLVAAAHERGLMVFLDVVYNHFGPEGNYLHLYAPDFFTERHHTPWGAAINFDGGAAPVRDFFIQNALYWLEEYRFDGLRLDAVHAIVDDSEPDILTELAARVHARFADRRQVHLVIENDNNAPHYLRRDGEGRPLCYAAQWNDDIHHCLHVAATGEDGGYYEDYADAPLDRLGRALSEGFAYQGQPSRHRGGRPRGAPSAGLPPSAFVSFLQNHDQVGNRALGERITGLADAEVVRALTALFLLAPQPPLLFMGEEWGTRQPFLFFCDFGEEFADAVRKGRRREFARFREFRDPAVRRRIPDPNAEQTFAASVLDWGAAETPAGEEWLRFHHELLRVRREEITPRLKEISGHAGSFRRAGRTGIQVRWRLSDGILQMAANLGPQWLEDVAPPLRGRMIYATGGLEPMPSLQSWPPWWVGWMIDASAGAAP